MQFAWKSSAGKPHQQTIRCLVGTFIIGNGGISVKPASLQAFAIITFFLNHLRVSQCPQRIVPAQRERPRAIVYLERQKQLATHVREFLRQKYQIDLPNIALDAPPKIEMGEFAMPFPFEL